MCSNGIRSVRAVADERTGRKRACGGALLLSWSGSRAYRHRLEPGEFSVSANHAPAARSVRAAAQARAPMRVLGGGSVDPAGRRSPVRPRVREGSLAVDGDARVGVVRSDGGALPRRRFDGRRRRRRDATQRGDNPCLGYAFYAPPGAVPRARLFPSGPVSADAVLLTSLGVESGHDAEGLSRQPDRVGGRRSRAPRRASTRSVRAHRRGDRACWTLDWCRQSCGPSLRCWGTARSTSASSTPICCRTPGSSSSRSIRYFPRLRLELEQGLGWKADVEAALERLLETAQLQQPVGAGASPCA